jgi:hypothetical protein
MSSQDKDWPSVCRIIWLSGGLVAINEPGAKVKIAAGINGPICHEFQLTTFASMYTMLGHHGFSIIGTTHVVDMDEANGIRPPEFRAWSDGIRVWHVSNVQQKWREVAHAASQKNEMVMMDMASRISSELSYCEMRLQQLAEAYGVQLGVKAKEGDIEEFVRFEDMHSSKIYLAIHALFWELAVLRDYMTEFSAKYLFGIDKVTSFGKKFLDQLANSKWKNDDVAIELLRAGHEGHGGWLATFSDYRNLFTHRAPMTQAAGIAFATQDQMAIWGGKSVPQLYYPLPGDVRELSNRRASGVLFKDMEELIATSRKIPKRETEPDALSYLHDALGLMALLAERMVQRSPIAPEAIHLTEADIIGPLQVRWPSGKV